MEIAGYLIEEGGHFVEFLPAAETAAIEHYRQHVGVTVTPLARAPEA